MGQISNLREEEIIIAFTTININLLCNSIMTSLKDAEGDLVPHLD